MARIHIPWKAMKGLKLGDAVKAVARAVGIKKECSGCDNRQKALNRFSLPK